MPTSRRRSPAIAAIAALLLSAGWTVAAAASPAHDTAPSPGARAAATGKDDPGDGKDGKGGKGGKDDGGKGGREAPSTAPVAPTPDGPGRAAPTPTPDDPSGKDKGAKGKPAEGAPTGEAPAKGKDDGKGEDDAAAPGAPGHASPGSEPTELPPAAPPVLARTVAADPVSGTVVVRLPGTRTILPLGDVSSLPVGSTIDARAGTVKLTSVHAAGASQAAEFHGAIFSVHQARGPRPVTVLNLRGGEHAQCDDEAAAPGVATASASRKPVRRLWGSGHGRFTTKGRHSAATVRGTIWLTEDRCDATFTRVSRGVVSVRDFGKGRTVAVRTGHSYLARAR